MILKSHTKASARKSEFVGQSRENEACKNKLVEKNEVQDSAKSRGKINSGKDRPTARLRFIKPIRTEMRKIRNSNKNKPTWTETGLAGRERERERERMEVESRKKSKRDRMMRSKRFQTYETKELGRMEFGK